MCGHGTILEKFKQTDLFVDFFLVIEKPYKKDNSQYNRRKEHFMLDIWISEYLDLFTWKQRMSLGKKLNKD